MNDESNQRVPSYGTYAGEGASQLIKNLSREELEALAMDMMVDSRSGLLRADAFYRMGQELPEQVYPLVGLGMDIVDLKSYNLVSYETGNAAIALVGQAIQSSIRNSDLACRFGGDEFLLLLDKGEQQSHDFYRAGMLAERIDSNLQAFFPQFKAQLSRPVTLRYAMGVVPTSNQLQEKNLATLIDNSYNLAPATLRTS